MLDRQDLKERMDMRVIGMMDAGYIEEVQGLLDAGVSADLKPMKSLGYKWLSAQLLDNLDPQEAHARPVLAGAWHDPQVLARLGPCRIPCLSSGVRGHVSHALDKDAGVRCR